MPDKRKARKRDLPGFSYGRQGRLNGRIGHGSARYIRKLHPKTERRRDCSQRLPVPCGTPPQVIAQAQPAEGSPSDRPRSGSAVRLHRPGPLPRTSSKVCVRHAIESLDRPFMAASVHFEAFQTASHWVPLDSRFRSSSAASRRDVSFPERAPGWFPWAVSLSGREPFGP